MKKTATAKKASPVLSPAAIVNTFTGRKRIRRSFGKIREVAAMPNLIEVQKDSYEQFVAQNRNDLAEVELAQMKVIEQFLPAQVSAEELEAEIKKIIAEVGAESLKDLGKVMGTASKALAGKSDGKSISEMVKKLL